MMFQAIEPAVFEEMFRSPASNIAIIGRGRSEVFAKLKSSYDLSSYRTLCDEGKEMSAAVRSGEKGLLITYPVNTPDMLMFILVVLIKERGDNSSEDVLLEEVKSAFDWIILTEGLKNYPARITKVLKAPFKLSHC